MHSSSNITRRALLGGASACLSKGNDQNLIALIRSVMRPSIQVISYELNN